ncbi:Ulp1 protease family, C-terminal catalytic domain containing protein [Trema orientale]|uniref:Ulp1 protease family, C-terminal catalytic domain containing protein n=1 Tax=Trema orientale TaxID=63057 RepID=A0A2P5FGK8_TREOI|nr:Ulp1 protease family, C-terminal catalytic domain containing protein [Trema orientale]
MKTLNLGTTSTNQKSWLYGLHEPKQWLWDDKRKYNIDRFRQSFTTTDTYFANYVETAWKEFKNSGGKVDWDQQSAIQKYVLGGRLACSFPWTEVDQGDEDDDIIIREKIEPMATLLPILLDFLGLFAERKDDYDSALFKVEHCPDNPQQDNTGDYGVFVIKYAKYLMHGYAISEVTQDKIHFFRRKLTFELYSHAMDMEENQVVSDLERD